MNSSNNISDETAELYQEYELLDSIYVTMNHFIPLSFALIGLIGNCLSFAVYSRRCFRDTQTGFYLRMMAITDTLTIVDWPELFKYTFGVDLKTYSSLSCKLLIYTNFSIPVMSTWLLCVTSLDRMVNISFKSRFGFLAKKRVQIGIVAFIVIFNSVAYAPMIVFFDVINDGCFSASDLYWNILGWFDLNNSTLVPFAGMLVSTVLILKKLLGSQKKMFKGKEGPKPKQETQADVMMKRRAVKDRQFAVTSIGLNLLFLILNISITVMNLIMTTSFNMVILFFFNMSVVLFKANFMCPFFVYLISNRRFRTELRDMFLCALSVTRMDRFKKMSLTNLSKVIND